MLGNTPKFFRRGFRGRGQAVFCPERALWFCFSIKPILTGKGGLANMPPSPPCFSQVAHGPCEAGPTLAASPARLCPGLKAALPVRAAAESRSPGPHRPVGAVGPRAAPLAGILLFPSGAADRILLPGPAALALRRQQNPCSRFSPSARPREGAAGGEGTLGPFYSLSPGNLTDLILLQYGAAGLGLTRHRSEEII